MTGQLRPLPELVRRRQRGSEAVVDQHVDHVYGDGHQHGQGVPGRSGPPGAEPPPPVLEVGAALAGDDHAARPPPGPAGCCRGRSRGRTRPRCSSTSRTGRPAPRSSAAGRRGSGGRDWSWSNLLEARRRSGAVTSAKWSASRRWPPSGATKSLVSAREAKSVTSLSRGWTGRSRVDPARSARRGRCRMRGLVPTAANASSTISWRVRVSGPPTISEVVPVKSRTLRQASATSCGCTGLVRACPSPGIQAMPRRAIARNGSKIGNMPVGRTTP